MFLLHYLPLYSGGLRLLHLNSSINPNHSTNFITEYTITNSSNVANNIFTSHAHDCLTIVSPTDDISDTSPDNRPLRISDFPNLLL